MIDTVVNITTLPDLECFLITIFEDSIIENSEEFDVVISSNDPAVSVDRMQSVVSIIDTTSRSMVIILRAGCLLFYYIPSITACSCRYSVHACPVRCIGE